MALENLTPENRVERLLSGSDLEPANRLEYFLKQAGSGSVEYEPVLAETTKSVNDHGWTTQSFSGGPIFEGTSYRVTVNGVTYEPLIGTAGDLSYICLGNTYVDDSDPVGDYPFGIFYKNGELTAWLETGESITMQIDQIIQLVPVPTPAAGDTGKVLTANNGAVEWAENVVVYPLDLVDPVYFYSFNDFRTFLTQGKMVVVKSVSSDPDWIPTYGFLTALGFQNNLYMASFGNSEINVSVLLIAETATEPMHFD